MLTQRMLLFSVASTALLTFFLASSAYGAFVQLTGTNWEYDTTPGVTFNLDGGTGGSKTPWLVTESYIDPPNDNPIVTHWRQTGAQVDGGDNNYFEISLYRANICEWTSYTWTIADDNGVPQAAGSHPEAAHFHTGPMTQYAPFTQLTPTGTGGNGVYAITVYDGPLPENSYWYASALKVHDYDNFTAEGATMSTKGGQPGATAFTITETPVPNCIPEPGTAATFATGCLILGIAAFRRGLRRARTC